MYISERRGCTIFSSIFFLFFFFLPCLFFKHSYSLLNEKKYTMALTRSLTKRLKNSVAKKFNTGSAEERQPEKTDEFYALNFAATNPTNFDDDKKINVASSVHSADSHNSSISRAGSVKRSGAESLRRASSLLSRKSSTSSRNISKPPSTASSPPTPATTSFTITSASHIPYSNDVYIPYSKADIMNPPTLNSEEIQNMLPPSAPLPLKRPLSHRTIPSVSSSMYSSSLGTDIILDSNGQPNFLLPSATIRPSLAADEALADEVAMKILEKVSAEEYSFMCHE